MKFSPTQTAILETTNAKTRVTAGQLGNAIDMRPGPTARSASSLVNQGLLKETTNKDGDVLYSRTAAGGKAAKSL